MTDRQLLLYINLHFHKYHHRSHHGIMIMNMVEVNYREEEFKDAIEKWTNGRGVDIILDCIGGRFTLSNFFVCGKQIDTM